MTVKKTIAARLRIVVTIAMKFVSILKRLKKRRTIWLCKNRAMISPAAKNPTKAISPRNRYVVMANVKQRPLQKRHFHAR